MAEPTLLFLVGNTSRLLLSGVKLGGVYLNADAANFHRVTSIKDQAKPTPNEITIPGGYPINLTAVDSTVTGEHEAFIGAGLEVVAESVYTVFVDLDDGDYRVGHWEMETKARVRDGVVVT